MKRRRKLRNMVWAGTGIAALCAIGFAQFEPFTLHAAPASIPDGERRLVIYSATDEQEASELLQAFRTDHPRLRIQYLSLRASEVYARFKSEADQGATQADLVINSAMDLQIKLVNDNYAQAYRSPELGALPAWAIWKDEAYAVSAEPIVFGYNARLLAPRLVPRSHDELASALHGNVALFAGRIGTYDPLQSPTGYLYITQDIRSDSDSWDLIGAMGRAQPRLFVSSKDMIDQIASGRLLFGYNLIGSYAFERAAKDPAFRVVVPQDFALLPSRVAIIPRNAPHPEAAHAFLDFMLSRRGQAILARHHMLPVRNDLPSGSPESATLRAVRVGPALMAGLDRLTFDKFRKKWLAATSTQAAAPIATRKIS